VRILAYGIFTFKKIGIEDRPPPASPPDAPKIPPGSAAGRRTLADRPRRRLARRNSKERAKCIKRRRGTRVLSSPHMPRFEAVELAKSFAGPPIFRDVSLSAERGLVAVTGPNGSGKSTLLKIFAGLTRPSRGSVAIWNDGAKLEDGERRRATGFASPELDFIDELTAVENLSLLSRAAGRPAGSAKIGGILDALGLARGAHDGRVGEFSSGMKQRVRLAFSLLLDPPVLLWDEPYSNLDAHGIDAAREVANARRVAGLVVLATNDRRDVADADREISLS
jgi:ABC-type multidrug transport system ATPase subunit